MMWVLENKSTWKSETEQNYSATVKVGPKIMTWTVFLKGKKVKSGKDSHPLDAMRKVKLFINGKII